jgi:hypothetical protein
MSANSGSRRFMAAIPDSTELLAAINGGFVQEAGVTYGATPSTP